MAYCGARTAANVGVLTVLLAIALSLFADIEDAVMLSRPRKQVRLQHERDSTLTEVRARPWSCVTEERVYHYVAGCLLVHAGSS